MAVYALCRALRHIYLHRAAAMAARAGDFSMLERFGLTPEERAAIERRDLAALYRLGAHPVVLFHFSTVLDPRESYVKEVVPRLQGVPNAFYDYYQRRKDRFGGG